MLTNICAKQVNNEQLRHELYRGVVYRNSATLASETLVRHVITRLSEATGSDELDLLQTKMGAVVLYSAVVATRALLENDATVRPLLFRMAEELGIVPNQIAIDKPRLRVILDGGHTNPLAKPAYYAHRDSWYGNPRCQINLWIPLHDVPANRAFLFYPQYFDAEIANDSHLFDHDRWVSEVGFQATSRPAHAVYPTVTEPLHEKEGVSFECTKGNIVLFAGAHLHKTIENSSGIPRFSMDIRLVHLGDHCQGLGAPDRDNHSKGSTLSSYMRGDDEAICSGALWDS